MNYFKHALCACFISAACVTPSIANEFEAELRTLASAEIAEITKSRVIIEAIEKQNSAYANLSQNEIDEMDQSWRKEIDEANKPLISEVLSREASKMLVSKRDDSGGLFTEIFVMDNHGLNVAQSDVTSDYWQGDEAKWQDTYKVGANAVHISDVEEDESTQTFQSQVSMSIVNPDTGKVIGAITVGVNVEEL